MEYRNVLTTCIYCGVGCGLYLQVLDGQVVGTWPAKGHPLNDGRLCVKGWYAHSFIHHPERLTTPLIRDQKGGPLRQASWEEALDRVAQRLMAIRETHGPDAIAFMASAKCTNEENYLLQKLARSIIGTHNVDHCARL